MPVYPSITRTSAAFLLLLTASLNAQAQEKYSLRQCLEYAVEHNDRLRKDRLGMEAAVQARREVLGAFLPQVSASAGLVRNVQKTQVAMPNFVNSMLPESLRDPDASKYMTVTMGMNYNANCGVQLSQQLINLPLLNALKIAGLAEEISGIGTEVTKEEVIAQTATLYCAIQTMSFGVKLYGQSIDLMDRTLQMMGVSGQSGIVRPVEVKQVTVNRTNLESEKQMMMQAIEIQKNLLKLQMGFPVDGKIEPEEMNVEDLEKIILSDRTASFDLDGLLPHKMLKSRQKMAELQYKAAVYDKLPVLSLGANYALNYMGDDFKGETFRHFPVSMVSLNLRIPLFTGLSKSAAVRKADIERKKLLGDERSLGQSLTMAYINARLALERSLQTMFSQKRNREMAQEVFDLVEINYGEGISSLSELLNANSSLIRSQMNYINALGTCLNAYIELKKVDGSICLLRHSTVSVE